MSVKVDHTKTDMAKRLEDALKKGGAFNTGKVGKVGWMANAYYTKEIKDSGDEVTKAKTPGKRRKIPKYKRVLVAEVAAQNEFGDATKGIPPRPTGRPAMKDNRTKLINTAKKAVRDVLKGNNESNDHVFELVGLVAASEWRRKIKQLQEPALAESTIKARLRKKKNKRKTASLAKPLIDSGIMLTTLTNLVEPE